ncbi:MAG TPA: alcohol dehydrogenase catalytic domain-containing protein [Solirubrobacterales bacterium]|nr:alcohol dehydrogenase catalytic domain-containing protein [Solirubrobacterales bacterium]
MRVRAALMDADLRVRIGERELGDPGPGSVLVKVDWAGVCGSDLHAIETGEWISEWPATLGHEVSGRVEALGEGVELALGTPVVIDSRIPCMECEGCATDPDRCTRVTVLGEACPGGFATHVLVPARSAHPVPANLQGEDAVLAAPLAVAFHAISRAPSSPSSVLVLGHGPLGALLHIELRRRFPQVEVSVAEPAPRRAELATALGARCVAEASSLSAAAFDLVIDAAGYRDALGDAVRTVRDGGTILLVALAGEPAGVGLKAVVQRRITIAGINAFIDELPEAIMALSAEPWRYRPVITHAIGLEELPDAIDKEAIRATAVKVLVHP